jgi:FkbM family methyltransferase
VGAYVGQSAGDYLAAFPEADVYCFEPAAETFSHLSEKFAGNTRVHCFRLALGAEPGEGALLSDERGSSFASLSTTPDVEGMPTAQPERVEVETLDRFTRAQGIDHIDFLKIDTEGHDLEVLRGADQLLRSNSVDLIEVEAGMNPENRAHVPIEVLKHHLEERGYSLFAFYEQVHEFMAGKPNLRRANPVFVSARVIAAHDGVGF